MLLVFYGLIHFFNALWLTAFNTTWQKRSRNRAFHENTTKKINLVMTPNSDEFPIVAWSQKFRYTKSQLYQKNKIEIMKRDRILDTNNITKKLDSVWYWRIYIPALPTLCSGLTWVMDGGLAPSSSSFWASASWWGGVMWR